MASVAMKAASVVGVAGKALKLRASHHLRKCIEIAAVGAAGRGRFFGTGEFEGEGQFIGGRRGVEVVSGLGAGRELGPGFTSDK